MAAVNAPLSKLDAVNMMLASIGQAPVSTLAVSGIRDVSIAALALDNTTREVLSKGWHFNTDAGYSIAPNVSGNVLVPTGALEIDPSDPTVDAVVRSNDGVLMLWDKDNQTWSFAAPVKCDIVWGFEFEALPTTMRGYIATRAARIFQSQVLGSEVLFQFTAQHEQEALFLLMRAEGRTKDRNWFRSGADVNSIFHRASNPVRY
jgi:hypothetical protein